MTGVTLPQRNDREQAIIKTPDAADVRNAAPLQVIPKLNVGGNIAPADRPQRRRTADDRLLAMIDALDANHRLVPLMRVITRPLPERSFVSAFLVERRNKPFDHQL